MIDTNFVSEKISLIATDLERLELFSDTSFSKAAGDYIRYSAIKNMMMEVIGRAIDINEHIISETEIAKQNPPKTYRETFLILGKTGILPADFAAEISKSAGFRNAIVHDYNNLDKNEIYRTVGDAITQYKKYCQFLLDYIKKLKVQ